MKKTIVILLDVLTILFLAGGYVIEYFTKRKLGMRRWINFYQMKMNAAVPMDILKFVFGILALLLTVFIFRSYWGVRGAPAKKNILMLVFLLILDLFFWWLSLFVNGEIVLTYYCALVLSALAVCVQLIRNGMLLWSGRR